MTEILIGDAIILAVGLYLGSYLTRRAAKKERPYREALMLEYEGGDLYGQDYIMECDGSTWVQVDNILIQITRQPNKVTINTYDMTWDGQVGDGLKRIAHLFSNHPPITLKGGE